MNRVSFPNRVWEDDGSGKWWSREPTREDHRRRAALARSLGDTTYAAPSDEPGDIEVVLPPAARGERARKLLNRLSFDERMELLEKLKSTI